MKKFLTALLILFSLASFSQTNSWFVTAGSNINVGGPAPSIKKQMARQGFDHTSLATFLGLTISNDHPEVMKYPNLLLHGGWKVKPGKSVYFIAGLADNARVDGYKIESNSTGFWLIDGTSGNEPSVRTKLYQLTAGFLYSQKHRAKWGLGPSLFFLDYKLTNYSQTEKHLAVMPGASFTGRIPLGKERSLVGVDLFSELNLAAPVKMKSESSDPKFFKPGTANMAYGSLGLALSIRR